MPSRVVIQDATRDDLQSESDKSFVSAETANASSRSIKGSQIDQSAAPIPSPSHRSLAPINSTSLHKNIKTKTDGSNLVQREHTTLPSSAHRSTSLSYLGESYFAQQPSSSGPDPRSPQTRRPPASRSSQGIETKLGPPPALSTQRSYAESPWRSPPPNDSQPKHLSLRLSSISTEASDPVIGLSSGLANERLRARPSKLAGVLNPRPATSDGVMGATEVPGFGQSDNDEERDATLRLIGQDRQEGKHPPDTFQEPSQTNQEDIFLNLARDGSVVNEPMGRSERRRSRLGASSFSQPRVSRPSSSSGRPNTSGGGFGEHQTHFNNSSFDTSFHLSPEKNSLASLRDSSFRNRPYAASAHPLEQQHRTRNNGTSFGTIAREVSIDKTSPETPLPYGRRRSVWDPSPGYGPKNHKQPNVSYTASRDYGSSPFYSSPAYRQEPSAGLPLADGTESTVSTTAPSTVWDELDDLKSRLRKLEITGILPKSSNAAMSTTLTDRPHTATTTMTTMSPSPKRRRREGHSPEASKSNTQGLTNLHPLLHSALAKAMPVMKSELYQALESTASDALSLAAMTGGGALQGTSSPVSIIGSAIAIDRQLRRKADSMCRSLTELCIALTEEIPENDASKARPGSRGTTSTEVTLPSSRLYRGPSDEAEAKTSSRIMSRLEARRASLLDSSPLNGRRGSPQEATPATETATPSSNRLEKSSSVILRNRSNGEEMNSLNSRRPSSRAATEIGHVRPSPQTRVSREYTSQHPLPSSIDKSQSTLPARKSYFSSASSSPLTPSVQPGHKRYLDRSTPPSSADSARLVEARQRRIASLGQGQTRIGLSSKRLRQSESQQ